MQDLTSPLLPRRVVSKLVGVSPATLDRWDALGIVSAAGRRRGPRLYSWRDVERLQQALYLIKTRHLSLVEVRDRLKRGAPQGRNTLGAGEGRNSQGQSFRAGYPRRGGVIAVALPRSARRRGAPGTEVTR